MNNGLMFHLGLEEVVVAIGLVGQPEVAKALLWSNVGEINADEERGRLLAAHHSLLAKGLITLQQNEAHPTEDLVQIATMLVEHTFIVRFSRGSGVDERVLAYYFRDNRILSHAIGNGVSHHLVFVNDRDQMVDNGAQFVELIAAHEDYPEVKVSEATLNKARELAHTAPDKLDELLTDAGMPETARLSLSEDLRQPAYRGSLMRVEAKDGQLRSDRGALLLKGKERLWLMEVQPADGEVMITIRLATQETLRYQIDALID